MVYVLMVLAVVMLTPVGWFQWVWEQSLLRRVVNHHSVKDFVRSVVGTPKLNPPREYSPERSEETIPTASPIELPVN